MKFVNLPKIDLCSCVLSVGYLNDWSLVHIQTDMVGCCIMSYCFFFNVTHHEHHVFKIKYKQINVKGVVHFYKKKTFADNLLSPMPSKMSMSFFLQSKRN